MSDNQYLGLYIVITLGFAGVSFQILMAAKRIAKAIEGSKTSITRPDGKAQP